MSAGATDRAEMALVAALLRDNAVLEDCAGLEEAHFSDKLCGGLFAAVRGKILSGEIATPSTMQSWATSKGVPFQVLVNAYGKGLDELPYVAANAREIRRGADMRALANALRDGLQAIAADANGQPLNVLSEVELALRALDLEGGASTDISGREAGERAIAALSAPRGWRSGYADLDAGLTGFRGGQLILIAGAPGQGKSSFAANLARRSAKRGKIIHFASYEMGDCDIGERLISATAYERGLHIPYFEFQNAPAKWAERQAELSEIAASIPETLRLEISGPQSLAGLEARARATRRKLGGLDAVFVDYLQLMSAMSKRASIYERTTEVSQGLKALAKRLEAPVFALTQISRENTKRGTNRRARLSDLRDSGSLEQDADLVLAVHRESYWLAMDGEPTDGGDEALFEYEQETKRWRNVLEITRLKQRQGPTGRTVLYIDEQYDIIENASEEMKARVLEKRPIATAQKKRTPKPEGRRHWAD